MAKQAQAKDPFEFTLLRPVMAMFCRDEYLRRLEVPLGQRKIDLLCIGMGDSTWVSVELKVRNWRNALVQAAINHQLVDKSYVALWHRHVPTALKHRDVFEQYNVGLIEVGPDGVRTVFDFPEKEPTLVKRRLRELVIAKLNKKEVVWNGTDEAIFILPA